MGESEDQIFRPSLSSPNFCMGHAFLFMGLKLGCSQSIVYVVFRCSKEILVSRHNDEVLFVAFYLLSGSADTSIHDVKNFLLFLDFILELERRLILLLMNHYP